MNWWPCGAAARHSSRTSRLSLHCINDGPRLRHHLVVQYSAARVRVRPRKLYAHIRIVRRAERFGPARSRPSLSHCFVGPPAFCINAILGGAQFTQQRKRPRFIKLTSGSILNSHRLTFTKASATQLPRHRKRRRTFACARSLCTSELTLFCVSGGALESAGSRGRRSRNSLIRCAARCYTDEGSTGNVELLGSAR